MRRHNHGCSGRNYNHPRAFKPEFWSRFRDDCFGIWTQGEQGLIQFTNFLSSIGQKLGWKTKLKFEVKHHLKNLIFLIPRCT